MKKLMKTLATCLFGIMALTACEDVPAPYTVPTNSGSSTSAEEAAIQAAGTGTAADPYNVKGVQAYISGSTYDANQEVYIKGIVTSFKEMPGNSYGNATFYIADVAGGSNTFYVYRCYGLNGDKFATGDNTFFNVGDTLVIKSTVTTYSGTQETVQNKGQIVTINGKAEYKGSSTPTPTPTGEEITVAKAVELTNALSDGATSTETYTVTGYITYVFSTISSNQQSFYMADTKDGGKVFEAYWANLPSGISAFTVGMNVKITGQLMKYVNSSGTVVPEMKNATVTIIEEGSGDTPSGATGDGTIDNPFNAAAANAFVEAGAYEGKTVYVKGIIKKFKSGEEPGNSYGNSTFYIADDASSSTDFYIFRTYGLNGEKFTSSSQLAVGDLVVIKAELTNYNGTKETKQGGSVVTINGKAEYPSRGESGGEETPTTGDGMSISDLPSDITSNAYGSQSVSDESTWLSWTYNGVTFKGCKVCKATSISGTIQVQGNASDATKQGFIFNATAWSSNIKKITVVLKVAASSTYDPSYSLYAGSSAHPTSSAITPTSTKTSDGTNNIYTQVFDLSAANAKYFTIANDKTGALYIEKVVIE